MEAKQMTLFSVDEALARMDEMMAEGPELDLATGWTLPAAETHLEESLSFEDACDVARAYGRETAERYHSAITVRDRIFGFVAGLAAANDFNADEQEYLRNVAWTHSDIVLQARQN